MIPVTKPYLPSREKLDKYIDGIYERHWLTNNGQLVQELTHRLEDYLGVENLLLVANGTLALQIAYRALGVSDLRSQQRPEAITTPFTFIATASSLKWDGVEPAALAQCETYANRDRLNATSTYQCVHFRLWHDGTLSCVFCLQQRLTAINAFRVLPNSG